MGFFDKKYCDICGDKIGLLGNRKLEDGNMCKDCAKKLSPWFDDRRHSTVDDIKAQLRYREENEEVLRIFHATRTFGKNSWHLYVDQSKKQFVLARNLNNGENHDVIPFAQVTGCHLDINKDSEEIYRTNKNGEEESYNPPRYKYTYDYTVVINVNAPYFDELRFELNDSSLEQSETRERREIEEEGKQIVDYILKMAGHGNEEEAVEGSAGPEESGQSGTWICPACGAGNTGRFCEYCGTARG